MRTLWTIIAVCIALGASISVARYVHGQEPRAARVLPITPNTVAVRILFGLKDEEPTGWDGSLAVTSGSVVRLEGWRFRQQDAVVGASGWRAMSRRQQLAPGAAQPARQAARAAAAAARRAQRQAAGGAGAAPGQGQAGGGAGAGGAQGQAGGGGGARRLARQGLAAQNPGANPAGPAAQGAMTPNGVVAILTAEPQAEVTVTTPKGEFRFKPWELAMGRSQNFLEGAAAVERVPASVQLTEAQTEDDFPAAAAGPDGTVWISYVAYHYGQPLGPHLTNMQQEPKNFDFLRPAKNGDEVRLARLAPSAAGPAWSEVASLTDPGQDVIRPAVAAAGDGSVWVVWSQNVRGNWDLYARRYRNGTLSNTMRVTTDAGPDLDPALATDRQGNVWLAWHGFRGDNFDIFLASIAPGSERWSEPVRVSTSPRNDWNAQIACDQEGAVYVVWDTYDQGSYDVMMRRMAGGKLDAPVAVANSARFEARPSIVCDGSNRVWVAWEEAPERWGKDFGFGVQDQGIPLYRQHTVAVRAYVNGKPYETAGALADVLPRQPNFQRSFPRLGTDGRGRVFLAYSRTHPELRAPVGTAWLSYVTFYEGNAWSPAVVVPDSDGLLDSRPTLVASGASGPLYMVYASDGRNHAFGQPPQYRIYAAPVSWERNAAATPSLVAAQPAAAPGALPDVVAERAALARIRGFRSNVGGKSYQLVRGDFHRHTEISPDGGGDGPLIDMFRYAIDAAGQDWICAGDHDNGPGREYTWWQIQKLDDALHMGTTFVPLFGYERSVVYPNGHRNVMFVQRGIRPLPRLAGNQPGNVSEGDTKMLYRYLRQFNGICASHTSATNMGTDWRDNDPKVEPFVEIYQGDRQNYEYQGAPRSGDAQVSPGGFQPAGFIWNALAKGYRFGFQASSDHISTHISFAVAYAERPTRQAIFDAFAKRHCYGATDNIVLEVRDGEHLMGDEFDTKQAPKLEIHAIGTKPIAKLVVVKDNQVVYTAAPNKADVAFTWVDNQPRPGPSYYYVRVEQADGQLAWASPMWMHFKA